MWDSGCGGACPVPFSWAQPPFIWTSELPVQWSWGLETCGVAWECPLARSLPSSCTLAAGGLVSVAGGESSGRGGRRSPPCSRPCPPAPQIRNR